MSTTERLNLPAKQIVGILLRTDNTKASHDIGLHWQRFFNENIIQKIPNKKSNHLYVLYTDYEKDHTAPYSVVIGCEVLSLALLPEGLVSKQIPSASYEVFTAKGEFPTSIIQTWQQIWNSDLPRAYSSDFEQYEEKFQHSHPEAKIYIALKNP